MRIHGVDVTFFSGQESQGEHIISRSLKGNILFQGVSRGTYYLIMIRDFD